MVMAMRTHVLRGRVGNSREWHRQTRPARLGGEPSSDETNMRGTGVSLI
jgi:hypothetical protein